MCLAAISEGVEGGRSEKDCEGYSSATVREAARSELRVSIVNVNLAGPDAIGRCVLNQVQYFRRRGDTVHVYTMLAPQDVADDVANLTRVVNLAQLVARRDAHFARSYLYVYHYPGRYPLIESIKGIDRGAVIFYFHNVTPPEYWSDFEERTRLQHSIDSAGPLSYYADLIVTPSPFNRDQLVSELGCDPKRVRVLPLAVELDQFAPGPKDPALAQRYAIEGKRVVLFVGRMASNKRIDLLVEALPLIKGAVSNATLLLVGDDRTTAVYRDCADLIRRRAAELGCAADVHLAGIVADVPAHYRLADVYASASLHEGFGVPLIEAMASGIPLVASRATAHPWLVGDAGLLVEPNSSSDMADKITRVLLNESLRHEMVRSGLARARDFSLERYEEGWAGIVAEATQGLPQPHAGLSRSLAAKAEIPTPIDPEPDAASSLPGRTDKDSPGCATWRNTVNADLDRIEAMSDVMIRGYVVRSRLPLVGGLIAWIRRTLTSHLREPYVDPIIERQIAFNRELVQLVRGLIDGLSIPADSQPSLSVRPSATGTSRNSPQAVRAADDDVLSRLKRIEVLLSALSSRLDGDAAQPSTDSTPHQSNAIGGASSDSPSATPAAPVERSPFNE